MLLPGLAPADITYNAASRFVFSFAIAALRDARRACMAASLMYALFKARLLRNQATNLHVSCFQCHLLGQGVPVLATPTQRPA